MTHTQANKTRGTISTPASFALHLLHLTLSFPILSFLNSISCSSTVFNITSRTSSANCAWNRRTILLDSLLVEFPLPKFSSQTPCLTTVSNGRKMPKIKHLQCLHYVSFLFPRFSNGTTVTHNEKTLTVKEQHHRFLYCEFSRQPPS